jgi:hypothetical protein
MLWPLLQEGQAPSVPILPTVCILLHLAAAFHGACGWGLFPFQVYTFALGGEPSYMKCLGSTCHKRRIQLALASLNTGETWELKVGNESKMLSLLCYAREYITKHLRFTTSCLPNSFLF